MFNLFKNKGCKLKHYKAAGHPHPQNMELVLRFDRRPDKWGNLHYGIYECSACGVRAFSCSACLIEHKDFESAVDRFIRREIDVADLLQVFERFNTSYKLGE